jgi:hypothetical protein
VGQVRLGTLLLVIIAGLLTAYVVDDDRASLSETVANQLQLTGFISASGHEETRNLIGHPIVLELNRQVLSLEAGMAVTAHSQAAANPQPAQMLNQSTFDQVELDS